jgi:phage protein D
MVLGASPDLMAPNFQLMVEGEEVDVGITDIVSSVEYESADGVADLLRVRCANPNAEISDSKIFHIGNEIELWGGYGAATQFIGAGVISKVDADFPQEGEPSMDIIAYSRDHQMMDNAPPQAKLFKGKGSEAKNKKVRANAGRIFKQTTFSDAVKQRAEDYLFKTDVDDTGEPPHDFVQTSGMSDYEFVQGLANLTGFMFWVDRTPQGDWFLHFKDPALISALQIKKYTFTYNTELATLLSFRPEMTFTGSFTKIVAHVKNARTGKLLKAEIEDGKVQGDSLYTGNPREQIIEPPPSGSGIKLYFDDYSIDIQTTKKFESEEALRAWAQQWFARNRDNFVLARGMIIGIETLRAREVHAVEGVGKMYSGDYQFDRVRHIFGPDGYVIDFHARRVLPDP